MPDDGDDESGQGHRTRGKKDTGEAQPEHLALRDLLQFFCQHTDIVGVALVIARLNGPHARAQRHKVEYKRDDDKSLRGGVVLEIGGWENAAEGRYAEQYGEKGGD